MNSNVTAIDFNFSGDSQSHAASVCFVWVFVVADDEGEKNEGNCISCFESHLFDWITEGRRKIRSGFGLGSMSLRDCILGYFFLLVSSFFSQHAPFVADERDWKQKVIEKFLSGAAELPPARPGKGWRKRPREGSPASFPPPPTAPATVCKWSRLSPDFLPFYLTGPLRGKSIYCRLVRAIFFNGLRLTWSSGEWKAPVRRSRPSAPAVRELILGGFRSHIGLRSFRHCWYCLLRCRSKICNKIAATKG